MAKRTESMDTIKAAVADAISAFSVLYAQFGQIDFSDDDSGDTPQKAQFTAEFVRNGVRVYVETTRIGKGMTVYGVSGEVGVMVELKHGEVLDEFDEWEAELED